MPLTTDNSRLERRFRDLLNRSTPLIPTETLQAFVAPFFHQRDLYTGIVQRYGSPLYLQKLDILRERGRRFKEAFQTELPEVAFYFAVKCNNHPNISRVLVEEGFGLDVSSGRELEMALTLGAGKIIFSGPGKTDQELEQAVANADRLTVMIDSAGELHRLATVANKLNRSVRCGVRICHNPAGLWRKFGIPLGDLPAFWEEASRCGSIDLAGLQFHTSWNLTPDAQTAFISELGKTVGGLSLEVRSKIRFVDIGGGYWPEQGEWLQPAATPEGTLRKALGESPGPALHHHLRAAAPIEIFARRIGAALSKELFRVLPEPCNIVLEPGRWVCNDALHLLMTVVDKKNGEIVITDAGTNAVGWERFESDYFPVLNLSRPGQTETSCLILGSLCTPHDIWGTAYFGSGIEPGDVLMIPTQGAYTYSLRQDFIKPIPQVVAL